MNDTPVADIGAILEREGPLRLHVVSALGIPRRASVTLGTLDRVSVVELHGAALRSIASMGASAIIRSVAGGSPAATAGLTALDVVLSFNGEPVTTAQRMVELDQKCVSGAQAMLTVQRPEDPDDRREVEIATFEGVAVAEIQATTARARGARDIAVVVQTVEDESSAAEAGLRPLDIVEAVSGTPVRSAQDVTDAALRPGTGGTLTLDVTWLLGAALTSHIELADLEGVSLDRLASAPLRELAEFGGGVAIVRAPGSPAQRAGLQPADVVLGVNGEPVHTCSDLIGALGSRRPGDVVRLAIIRRLGLRDGVTPEVVEATLGAPPAAPTE